jgi:hypothetical protein
LEIGEHSDEIHWQDGKAFPADEWIAEIVTLRNQLDRAEGLLRAYNLVVTAEKGETDDDTSAC